MKQEKKILIILFLCGFWTVLVQAQETIPATGGNATGSGGSVSYTVGQIAYSTLSGTNGSVIQGVQQPIEISVVTGVDEARGINLLFSAYPNPATDFVTLKVGNYDNSDLSYELLDINGILLENKKIEGIETTIQFENRTPSVYFLKVTDNNKVVKTFKIIKN
jgi:opacity protein-like surface antigen